MVSMRRHIKKNSVASTIIFTYPYADLKLLILQAIWSPTRSKITPSQWLQSNIGVKLRIETDFGITLAYSFIFYNTCPGRGYDSPLPYCKE